MLHRLDNRAGHYALLSVVWAALCLPNLGGPGLWDIDEGNNATCAYEMSESGNWVVPTFNNRLRDDKPALLYWLQATAYHVCGVNEWAARLPSALAALLAVLATYELGRRMFGASVGLLGGLVLASAALACGAAHFANPDALLNACAVLTMLSFWRGLRTNGNLWGPATGVTCGLAVLAKGPIGLLLPAAVTCGFLLGKKQLRRLGGLRVPATAVVFLAVAAPWYVWVALETKGQWLAGFWQKHHQSRVFTALENHGGPPYYYLLVLIVGLAPWSVFLALTCWHTVKRLRREGGAWSAPWRWGGGGGAGGGRGGGPPPAPARERFGRRGRR